MCSIFMCNISSNSAIDVENIHCLLTNSVELANDFWFSGAKLQLVFESGLEVSFVSSRESFQML